MSVSVIILIALTGIVIVAGLFVMFRNEHPPHKTSHHISHPDQLFEGEFVRLH